MNSATVTYQFLGNVVINHTYDSASDAESAIADIEDSFFEIDGKWYNGLYLVVANSDPYALEILYDFGGEQLKAVYEDSAAFEEAIAKLESVSGGSGGGSGGGGKRTATPTFSVKPGAVDVGTKFTISCATEGATIHYTTDGTDATLDSPVYTAGTQITVPEEGITVKAVAVVLGLATSSMAVGKYTKYVGPAKRYAGWYVGATPPATLTESDITGLDGLYTDELTEASSPDPFSFVVTENVAEESGCIVWAYPAEYGDVTKFKDGLGTHDISDSYLKKEVTINDVAYNVYILDGGTGGEVGEEIPQVFIAE